VNNIIKHVQKYVKEGCQKGHIPITADHPLLSTTKMAPGGAQVPPIKAKIRKLGKFDDPYLRNRTSYRNVDQTRETAWPLDYNVE